MSVLKLGRVWKCNKKNHYSNKKSSLEVTLFIFVVIMFFTANRLNCELYLAVNAESSDGNLVHTRKHTIEQEHTCRKNVHIELKEKNHHDVESEE